MDSDMLIIVQLFVSLARQDASLKSFRSRLGLPQFDLLFLLTTRAAHTRHDTASVSQCAVSVIARRVPGLWTSPADREGLSEALNHQRTPEEDSRGGAAMDGSSEGNQGREEGEHADHS